MSFLMVENLGDLFLFILRHDFVEKIDLTVDLNNGLKRISNLDKRYVKRPLNRIITEDNNH